MRPVCGSCLSLQITCNFADDKPTWMDGAVEQRKMSETIKNEIKRSALRKRETQNLRLHNREMVVTLDHDNVTAVERAKQDFSILPAISNFGDGIAANSDRIPPPAACFPAAEKDCGRTNIGIPSRDLKAMSLTLGGGMDLGLIMIYLDHVFPFLFPFYRPSLLETGRHWLLSLLCQNDVSFHTAASLSSYFYYAVVQGSQEGVKDSCRILVWDKLMEQMDMAVKTIQEDIEEIRHDGEQVTLIQHAHILSEVIQLLIVEVTVHRNVDWSIHLTAALDIFGETFRLHSNSPSQSNLDTILNQLSQRPFAMEVAHDKPLPNTADQSALVFFIAILVFVDIMSSTALEKSPTLQDYHANLLSNHTKFSISLADFVGCQNWVLLIISDISALNGWKKGAICTGNMLMVDLVHRAESISRALKKGLASLDTEFVDINSSITIKEPLDGYYTRINDTTTNYASTVIATGIWAHATNIYLSVVVSGWQNSCIEVQTSVEKALSLLQSVKSPAQLRSLSWPLCVAGCLASRHQEQEFRDVIEKIGRFREFGTISEALGIMEAVWKSRDTLNGEVWDIAACLRILGSPALLI